MYDIYIYIFSFDKYCTFQSLFIFLSMSYFGKQSNPIKCNNNNKIQQMLRSILLSVTVLFQQLLALSLSLSHSLIVSFTFSASIDLLPFTMCILFESIALINNMLQFRFRSLYHTQFVWILFQPQQRHQIMKHKPNEIINIGIYVCVCVFVCLLVVNRCEKELLCMNVYLL